MDENNKKIRMAIIAGAARAIRFKMKNFRATENEVIQHITDSMDEILEKIDEEL